MTTAASIRIDAMSLTFGNRQYIALVQRFRHYNAEDRAAPVEKRTSRNHVFTLHNEDSGDWFESEPIGSSVNEMRLKSVFWQNLSFRCCG